MSSMNYLNQAWARQYKSLTFKFGISSSTQYKMVSHMTGNLGRKMRVSALVVTGNGKGLAGKITKTLCIQFCNITMFLFDLSLQECVIKF